MKHRRNFPIRTVWCSRHWTKRYLMSVVGKSTCSGFKIGLPMFNRGGHAVKFVNQMNYFLKLSDFWSFWYQIYNIDSSSNRTSATKQFEHWRIVNFLTLNRSILAWHSSLILTMKNQFAFGLLTLMAMLTMDASFSISLHQRFTNILFMIYLS